MPFDDELDGQGAVIDVVQPREIWKNDAGRSPGNVVFYYFQRPKNLEIGVYRRGLPVGTEVSLFGFGAADLVKFAHGGLGHTTYTPAPRATSSTRAEPDWSTSGRKTPRPAPGRTSTTWPT